MRVYAILLGALLALGACSASAEEEVETAIREGLSERGTVLQVDMTPQENGNMTGFAILRNHAGTEVRMDCTVEREGDSNLMKEGFSWRCLPAEANARAGRAPEGGGH